jgi:DnaJ family protein A protein 5
MAPRTRARTDKNAHRVEEATERFQAITAAHTVLSNTNERAWYDAHREQILLGGGAGGGGGGDSDDDQPDADAHLQNLWRYFSPGAYDGFGDGSRGFFSVYRAAFETVAAEERRYGARDSDGREAAGFPGFGHATTPYDAVHEFYSFWNNFSTTLSYTWRDRYNTTEVRAARARASVCVCVCVCVFIVAHRVNEKLRTCCYVRKNWTPELRA